MLAAATMCGRTRALGSARDHSKGKEAKYTEDALAHAHKTIGRSPHRLPSFGNPGILLYANDMTSASAMAGEALGAVAAGTQRHGWCSELLILAYVARSL